MQAAELTIILQENRPSVDRDDRWLWGIDNNQQFTVKSCYGWLINCSTDSDFLLCRESVNNVPKIWKCDVPTKVQILTWKTLLYRLPTRDALARRGIITNVHELSCVLCFGVAETVDHLFCSCATSGRIWEAVMAWLGLPRVAEEEVNSHFFCFGQRLKGRKLKRVKFGLDGDNLDAMASKKQGAI